MSDSFDLGGSGGASFSFGPQGSQPGASVTGTVLDMKEVQETNYDTKKPEFWENGDPKMQYRVTLQTDLRDPMDPHDDGQRNIYLNGYRKPHPKTGTSGTLFAVLEAVRTTTGGAQLQRGGKLTLQWVSGMGFTGDPRHYHAWYEAPAMQLDQPPAPPAQQAAPQPPAQTPQAAPSPPPAAPPAPPAQQPAQPPQWAQSEQGPVNTTTGEVPAAAPAPQQAAPAAAGPTAEQVAAVRAAGLDPATVYPGYQG